MTHTWLKLWCLARIPPPPLPPTNYLTLYNQTGMMKGWGLKAAAALSVFLNLYLYLSDRLKPRGGWWSTGRGLQAGKFCFQFFPCWMKLDLIWFGFDLDPIWTTIWKVEAERRLVIHRERIASRGIMADTLTHGWCRSYLQNYFKNQMIHKMSNSNLHARSQVL